MEHEESIVDEPIDENDSTSSMKLGTCEVCGSNEAKYTCPRCEVKTCCLTCVNIHKKELDCDGARSKILYKPLSKFQNLDLLSDYRLLEDVTRSVQKIRTDPVKRVSRFLPAYLHFLGKASRDRGMRLHFLPRNFKRARENSSRLVPGTPSRIILWRIEWLFPQSNVRLISEKVPETCRLAEALSPLLDPDNDLTRENKEELQYYFSAGLNGVCALLRVGEMERNRYHVLDLDASIRGNLMKKSIVEFPTILVILKDHKYSFDVYDSDEEIEQWKGNWEAGDPDPSLKQGPVKPRQKKDNDQPHNLLFSANDSSSEEEL